MAKYNRAILVPYLNDVCSAEMLCSKLKRELAQCRNEVLQYRVAANEKVVNVNKPQKKSTSFSPLWIVALVCVLLGVLFFLSEAFLLAFPLIVIGGKLFFSAWESQDSDGYKAEEDYKRQMEYYEKQTQRNAVILAEMEKNQTALQNGETRLSILNQRMESAEALRRELYGANIIPSKYRNIYVAYYLYDYFSTSKEDDLDKIIQTLLLDEIIQRLDKIIIQNEEILLNQRVQMALQEQNNRMLAENHQEQMKHIAQIEANQEMQIEYENIIAKHQMATNFFLTADYLYKRNK